MKAKCFVFLLIPVVVLLAISLPAHASRIDDERTELSARQSYVFKTYLQADDIKIQSIDGVVTLTGTVSEESHRSLAQETVADLPGSRLWTTGWKSKGNAPPRTPMHGSQQR